MTSLMPKLEEGVLTPVQGPSQSGWFAGSSPKQLQSPFNEAAEIRGREERGLMV